MGQKISLFLMAQTRSCVTGLAPGGSSGKRRQWQHFRTHWGKPGQHTTAKHFPSKPSRQVPKDSAARSHYFGGTFSNQSQLPRRGIFTAVRTRALQSQHQLAACPWLADACWLDGRAQPSTSFSPSGPHSSTPDPTLMGRRPKHSAELTSGAQIQVRITCLYSELQTQRPLSQRQEGWGAFHFSKPFRCWNIITLAKITALLLKEF